MNIFGFSSLNNNQNIGLEDVLIKLSRVVLIGVLSGVVFVGLVGAILSTKSTEATGKTNRTMAVTAMDQVAEVANSSVGSGELEEKIEDNITTADARPLLIKRYLEKYKSPLVPYSDLIFELSQTYGFDYYWIVAIGQQESNLCKKIPDNSFNCWGYGIHKKGTLRFENYELALRSYAEYLKREYFDKGLNTPELIMKKYCPSSNGSWAFGVNQFIREIESGNF